MSYVRLMHIVMSLGITLGATLGTTTLMAGREFNLGLITEIG